MIDNREAQEELSEQLYHALFQTLKPLPDFLEILNLPILLASNIGLIKLSIF